MPSGPPASPVKCSRCGRSNEAHYKFCLGCGVEMKAAPARLGPAEPAPLRRPPPDSLALGAEEGTRMGVQPLSERSPSASGAVYCRHCGALVDRGLSFCGACGTRVATTPSPPAPRPAGGAPPGGTAAMEGGDFAPRRAGKAVAQLVLIDSAGADGGSLMLKEGDTPVGRACGAHIFEADPHLSPRHATLRLSGGHAQVRDEASLNGVFVRLRGEASLEEGDQLRIGQELLRFERLDPGPPPAAPDGTRPFGSPAPEDAWGRLVQVAGPQQAGDAYFLRDREVVLGRAYGDVLFPDDQFVSGTHCRLSRRGGKVLLTDLGSSNGTYLRVQGEAPVEFGDLLLMGQQLFQLREA